MIGGSLTGYLPLVLQCSIRWHSHTLIVSGQWYLGILVSCCNDIIMHKYFYVCLVEALVLVSECV